MSTPKKQHYVPQFYLRNFSLSDGREKVRLYRIPDDRLVERASIRDVAHENNFYKEARFEEALGAIDSMAAGLFRDAVEREALPDRFSEGHHALLVHTLVQAFRTRAAADEIDEQSDKLFKAVYARDDRFKDHLHELTVGYRNAPAYSVGAALHAHVLLFDLWFKLLRNRTEGPFVTSDHPAVLYNQFLEGKPTHGSNTGLAVKGLQIFLPLGPWHTLVFFDKDVYKVGGLRPTSVLVDVTDPRDVAALNTLQAANANEHLFFNEEIKPADVRALVRKAGRFRRSDKVRVDEFVPQQQEPDTLRTLILLHRTDVRTGLRLRCIATSPHAERYDVRGKVVHLRNPGLCRMFDAYNRELGEGRSPAENFFEYLKSRRQADGADKRERR